MSWETKWLSQYEEVRRHWSLDHPGQSDPSFWELPFSPNDQDITVAIQGVVDAVEHRTNCHSFAAVLLLFFLLRTRLSNVRLNRLWPEVARELSKPKLIVSPEQCGNFFRNALDHVFGREIPWCHNRFVAWCLDQTAVGSKRVEVVAKFLAFLLEQLLQNPSSESAGRVAHRLVEDFLTEQPDREEIEVYQIHLEHTGRAIVELVRELRSGNVFHELGFWTWDQLRDWWLSRSGNDLNRLTPETRHVLESLLARWGDRISRTSLAQFLMQTGLSFKVPRLEGGSEHGDPVGAPLGPIRLESGSSTRDIQLCDELGMTADQICAYRPECWHPVGDDGVLVWSRHSFIVEWSDGTRECSRPFFAGRTVAEAQYVGTYWSSHLILGLLPRVIDRTFDSLITPRLRIRTQWVLGRDGFRLHLLGFTIAFLHNSTKARLLVDGQVTWSGLVSEAPYIAPNRPVVLKRLTEAEPELTLVDAHDRVLCSVNIPCPWDKGAFLSLNGYVQEQPTVGLGSRYIKEKTVFPSGIIIGVSAGQPPHITGGRLEAIREKIPGLGWRLYRVLPDSTAQGLVRVATGLHYWELLDAQPVELVDDARELTLPSGVEVTGTGRIKPVTLDDPILLRLPLAWLKEDVADRLALRLVVRTPTRRLHSFGPDMLRAVQKEHADVPGTFSLNELAAGTAVDLPNGILWVHVESPRIGSSEPVCLFRCPDMVEPVPGCIGETAYLRLALKEGLPDFIRSHHQIGLLDVQQCQKAEGWLDCGRDGAVGFRWIPRIEDALLLCEGVPLADKKLLSVPEIAKPLQLVLLGDQTWLVTAGGVSRCFDGDQCIEVMPLLSEAVAAKGMLSGELVLSIVPTRTARAADELLRQRRHWRFDPVPVDFQLEAQWNSGRDGWQLNINLTWLGFTRITLTGELRNHQDLPFALSPISSSVLACAGSELVGKQKWTHSFPLEPSLALSLNLEKPGSFSICYDDRVLQQFVLPLIPDALVACRPVFDAESARSLIRELVQHLGSPPECDDERLTRIIFVCEQYVREEKQFPFPNLDGLIGRIVRHGSESCRLQAVASLRLLKSLSQSLVEYMLDIPFNRQGPLQLMLATLTAIHQSRLYRTGQADPDRLRVLTDIFEALATTEGTSIRRQWAKLMAAFCRDQNTSQPENDNRAGLDKGTIAAAVARPLAGFDSGLNQWLTAICMKG